MADDTDTDNEKEDTSEDESAESTPTNSTSDSSSDDSAPAAPPESDADRKARMVAEDAAADTERNPAGGSKPLTSEESFQHQRDIDQKARGILEKQQAVTERIRQQYIEMLRQDQAQNASYNPQGLEQPTPPPPNQQQNQTWMGQLTNLLAVTVPIAMLFGLRGNGFAKGAMMSAMGSFMTNYAKGREEASKDSWKNYQEQVKAINESNKERIALQKEVLANKKLSLDDQFKIQETLAKNFTDLKGLQAARDKDMTALTRHLEHKETAAARFAKGTRPSKVPHPPGWELYVEHIKDVSRKDGHMINPDKDQESQDEAASKYEDFDTWDKGQKAEKDAAKRHPSKEEDYKRWMSDNKLPANAVTYSEWIQSEKDGTLDNLLEQAKKAQIQPPDPNKVRSQLRLFGPR